MDKHKGKIMWRNGRTPCEDWSDTVTSQELSEVTRAGRNEEGSFLYRFQQEYDPANTLTSASKL